MIPEWEIGLVIAVVMTIIFFAYAKWRWRK